MRICVPKTITETFYNNITLSRVHDAQPHCDCYNYETIIYNQIAYTHVQYGIVSDEMVTTDTSRMIVRDL